MKAIVSLFLSLIFFTQSFAATTKESWGIGGKTLKLMHSNPDKYLDIVWKSYRNKFKIDLKKSQIEKINKIAKEILPKV